MILSLKIETEMRCRWIRCFFHCEYCRDNMSKWDTATSSVLQESVLGPLLLKSNDIPNKIKNKCKLYADDSKMIVVAKKNEYLGEDIHKGYKLASNLG